MGQRRNRKMFFPEFAWCIQKYRVIQNDCRGTIVQRQFRTKLGKQPPSDNSIGRRYVQFQETGCLCIPELKVRIRTDIETITADMRNELHYRVDVCRITNGAHIEHLYGMWQKLGSVVLLNKKIYIYCYLKCTVYDKLLKPRQSFRIILRILSTKLLHAFVVRIYLCFNRSII